MDYHYYAAKQDNDNKVTKRREIRMEVVAEISLYGDQEEEEEEEDAIVVDKNTF